METISNMANTAAKAVWGQNESKQEPVSGKTGDVSKGEPYDAGNMEPEAQENIVAHATDNKTTGKDDTNATNTKCATTNGVATNSPSTSDTDAPQKTKDSSLPRGDHSGGQGDVHNPDQRTKPDNAFGGDSVGHMEDGTADLDGPGPRPMEEVARERGGDAGKTETSDGGSGSDVSGVGARGEDEEDGPQTKSQGEGTGEKYVKSSGLKADGGDFDAANPGAGREADRLLEEKGVHKDGSGDSKTSHGGEGKEHRKLGEKLKQKLHKGHGSS